MANEILAETTIAGQEGVITYLANSAALQQFEQTSLAYLSLIKSDKPLDEEGLCSHVEQTLNEVFQVETFIICFNHYSMSFFHRLILSFQGRNKS